MAKHFEWLYRDPTIFEPTDVEMNSRELGSLVTAPLLGEDSSALTRIEIELELPGLLQDKPDAHS